MPDLTPQERQKIYLEEKARLEIRRDIKGEKTNIGKILAFIILGLVTLLMGIGVLMSIKQKEQNDAIEKALTPQQKHDRLLRQCADFLVSIQYKTYAELSMTERQEKAACEMRLEHPDQTFP